MTKGLIPEAFNNVKNLFSKKEEKSGVTKEVTIIPRSILAIRGLIKELFCSSTSSNVLSISLTKTLSPIRSFFFKCFNFPRGVTSIKLLSFKLIL